MPALTDLDHVVLVIAEGVSLDDVELPEPVTLCEGYRLTPDGEEREARLWPTYAVALRDTGYTVHLRASMPDTLGDLTVVEARLDGVEAALAGVDDLPSGTLLLVALAGGPGGPGGGVLVVRTPWAVEDRLYDEACDHTSVMRLVEAWTAARGRAARVRLPAERLRGLDDLVGALDLTDPDPTDPDLTQETDDE